MPPTTTHALPPHTPPYHAYPHHARPPPVDRMTDSYENITFPQLLLRTVIIANCRKIHDLYHPCNTPKRRIVLCERKFVSWIDMSAYYKTKWKRVFSKWMTDNNTNTMKTNKNSTINSRPTQFLSCEKPLSLFDASQKVHNSQRIVHQGNLVLNTKWHWKLLNWPRS